MIDVAIARRSIDASRRDRRRPSRLRLLPTVRLQLDRARRCSRSRCRSPPCSPRAGSCSTCATTSRSSPSRPHPRYPPSSGRCSSAHWIIKPIEQLRHASRKIAAGELAARAPRSSGPASSRISPHHSTKWRATSSKSSTRGGNSSPGRATTSAHRSPQSKRCSRRSKTASHRADEYLPPCANRCGGSSLLVDDLFELACIDAGALALELQQTAPRSHRRGLSRRLRSRSPNPQRPTRANEATCDHRVLGAPEQVERVLLNLLTNALRHTPSDGTVAVELEPAAEDIQ